MEENYPQTMRTTPFNEDEMLMQQVVGEDYELLLIDMLLKESFKEVL